MVAYGGGGVFPVGYIWYIISFEITTIGFTLTLAVYTVFYLIFTVNPLQRLPPENLPDSCKRLDLMLDLVTLKLLMYWEPVHCLLRSKWQILPENILEKSG